MNSSVRASGKFGGWEDNFQHDVRFIARVRGFGFGDAEGASIAETLGVLGNIG